MDGSKRRQNRVQGGWATKGIPTRKGDSNTKHQRQNNLHKELVYQEPSQDYKKQMIGKPPRNFSWFIEGLLAGCGLPEKQENVEFLHNQGIRYIVSLTHNRLPVIPGLVQCRLSVPEFESPTIEQVEEFVKIVERAHSENKAVAVHCYWGRGRTGTMLACYLVKAFQMEPQAAINETRRRRPMSIEVEEQEQLVFDYWEHLRQSKK